jgi:hypothetical protein
MKTGKISLITLCGLVMAFGPFPLAGQTTGIQTQGASAISSQSKDVNPAQSSLPAANTDNRNVNPAPKPVRFSAGLDDIVKLAKSGVDEAVILAFVQSSPVAYHPSAQEILKLRELGISSSIISALLRRGSEVRDRTAQAQKEASAATIQSAAPAAVSTPQPAAATSSAYPPSATYYAPSSYPVTYPSVVYTYPSYPYAVPSYGYYGYGGCYYPRNYSCYSGAGFYGGFYPGVSVGLNFGGVRFSGHYGGFRHHR